jgi:hypothetical protein
MNCRHFACYVDDRGKVLPGRFRLRAIWMFAASLLAILLGLRPVPAAEATGHGMVVSTQRLASEAGLTILKAGGNAIDAAVAVGYGSVKTSRRAFASDFPYDPFCDIILSPAYRADTLCSLQSRRRNPSGLGVPGGSP